jgi:acetolactate synthase-1/3 small subunit
MRHTISVLCDDTPGVMTRVSGLFSRRGFNIESLSVGHTELPGKSRFTIVTTGDDTVLEQVRKQLQKLVHVIKAWDIKQTEAVEREHGLVKIEVENKRRAELLQIITAVQARIVDSTGSIWIFSWTIIFWNRFALGRSPWRGVPAERLRNRVQWTGSNKSTSTGAARRICPFSWCVL